MIDGHKARVLAALLLSVFLFGCENKVATAAQDKRDCFDARLRYRAVIDAMCSPWSERRGIAISELAEDAQQGKIADPDSDPSQDIFEAVSHVTAKDCVRAGFPDPGEKIVDPQSERDRQSFRQFLKTHPEFAKPEVAPAAKARAEKHTTCDLWAK
jgi:hypothetical protein